MGALYEKHASFRMEGNTLFGKQQHLMNHEWQEFFFRMGGNLAIAYVTSNGYAEIFDNSEYNIEEVWNVFCEVLDIDPSQECCNLEELISKSSNPPR